MTYVSQKIAYAAAAISIGLLDRPEEDERGQPLLQDGIVTLGNLEVCRDFGFAADYVEAMHAMLRSDSHTRSVRSAKQLFSTSAAIGPITPSPMKIRSEPSTFTTPSPTVRRSTRGFAGAQRPLSADLVAMMVDHQIQRLVSTKPKYVAP